MKTQEKIFSPFVIASILIPSLYAANTLIQNIKGGQISAKPGSYNTRIMTIENGDLRFMNKGNDDDIVGDYFSWYYFDPAFGFFETNTTIDRVRISSQSVWDCSSSDYDWYELTGHSYNLEFGFVDFNLSSSVYTYICIPKNGNNDILPSYIGWYAYSQYIGFQNFDGITLDSSVDMSADHLSDGRLVKVDGIVSSKNNSEAIDGQFSDDVRVLGKITKSGLRKNIHKELASVTRNISPDNGVSPYTVEALWNQKWTVWDDGKTIQDGTILYFWNLWGHNVEITGGDVQGVKTLIVEWGNIYISWNIRGGGMLGIIVTQKNGVGGNIYIDPSVTDIHAILYADRSLMSYNPSSWEYDGDTQADILPNQLYIRGTVLSENTIGGAVTTTCPYYINNTCNLSLSKKYDLNYLRRYILVQPTDEDGNVTWLKIPQYNGQESYMNTLTRWSKPDYRNFPLVIEYNPLIQQTPPPLFH